MGATRSKEYETVDEANDYQALSETHSPVVAMLGSKLASHNPLKRVIHFAETHRPSNGKFEVRGHGHAMRAFIVVERKNEDVKVQLVPREGKDKDVLSLMGLHAEYSFYVDLREGWCFHDLPEPSSIQSDQAIVSMFMYLQGRLPDRFYFAL